MIVIESIDEAAQNAKEFQRIEDNLNSDAFIRFSMYSHWYYFPDLDIFAPSKFIGYKNTSIENYNGYGHGTETQGVLSKWFTKVGQTDPRYNQLKNKLERYAEKLGKKIGKKTFHGTGAVYLPSKEYSKPIHDLSEYEEYSAPNYPDEVDNKEYIEGAVKKVTVNGYERNPKARRKCLEHHGTACYVCKFDFSAIYGKELGAGFIHVHHLVDIASIGKEYVIDPITELLPLCPNCHAMVHKKKPAMHPDELKKIIAKKA